LINRIVFVGRLEIVKGVMHIPLLARALKQRGFKNFIILVAGDGTAKLKCIESSILLGVEKYIQLLGWQNNLLDVFSNSDVLIFPSLCNESFGLAPLEAIANGLQVVAYDVWGVGEALQDAPGAYIVPRGDIDAMADAIKKALKMKNRIKKSDGFEYIQKRYYIQRTAREIETIYKEFLNVG